MNANICMVQLNLRTEFSKNEFYTYIEEEIFKKLNPNTHLVVFPENINLALLFARKYELRQKNVKNIFENLIDWLISKLNLRFILDAFDIDNQKNIILNTMQQLAYKYNVYVATGTYYEKCATKRFNAYCLINNYGKIVTSYKKYKLLGIEKALGISSRNNPQSIYTPFARIGLCICYDMNFEDYIKDICKLGVDVLLCPSNGFRISKNYPFDKIKERPQVQRAQENGVYIVRPYCAGSLFPFFYFQGHSHAVDKNGNTIAESKTLDQTELLQFTISI